MTAVIIDCETTGRTEPIVPVEIAYQPIESIYPLVFGRIECERYHPGRPIEYGAMATHGIALEDLEGCRPAVEFRLPAGTTAIVGHNVDYDWAAIGKPEVLRIDTCAISRLIWPTLDSHALFAVLWHVDPSAARAWRRDSHGAATDVVACNRILREIVRAADLWTLDELHALSERARIPTVMPFGKHRGARLEAIPIDYVRWLLGQPDVDPYLRRALESRT